MKTKKNILVFSALTLIFALVFSGCGPHVPEETTDEASSELSTETEASDNEQSDLEHLTDEYGENVTKIEYDDEGNEVVYEVFVPAGENTTAPANTPDNQSQVPTVTGQISDSNSSLTAIKAIADAFSSGRFHLVSKTDDGEKTDLMLYDGNMRVDMPFDDSVLALLMLDNEFYLLNPEKQTYTELNRSMLSLFGMNLDDMNFSEELKEGFVRIFQSSSTPEVSTVSVGGQAQTVYTYKNSEGETSKIYLNGNSPVKIESFKADGSSALNMEIENFNPNIKAEDLNVLSRFTKQGLAAFIGNM